MSEIWELWPGQGLHFGSLQLSHTLYPSTLKLLLLINHQGQPVQAINCHHPPRLGSQM